MTRKQTIIVKLKRSSTGKPWGIRIAGGADLGTPIVVTRSENETLQRGDVIKKIDDYDARDVRHVDAQNLLQNSESIRLVIERAKQRKLPSELPKSPVPPPSIDEYNRPTSSPDHLYLPHEHLDEVREERAYLSQPYRTTPLVLPGAKIKKDAPLGECYLRHHPNPMIRAAPHHYEPAHPEVAMKQKVVHKQFNSPIGLYSEENIADTIKCQASAIPPKKPMKYDPSKSEAYKALQEEALGDTVQEVKQPARTGVFSPQKVNQNRIYHARPKSPAGPYVNILDDDGEKIHQSNSFKRIMYSVLGQTDY
ncbi:PDZ and LIM domain protein 3 isoform X5 [Apis cerana]|uniref:PDZ and LIM domain protein 3 isoform X5 n=1 Tax=Apis cerana TaxID=7461 RepID=UPI002B234D29|nr:PDZ and LIM domain protein 3 isoform X5 [Apis cerana]XP_061936275.1 PDZ and LIM domain protein 3 isoform X5 [Apis cerana]XP_061936276.1 PDZ and LIM domain protein 3 isoform X5 [Apis cerana]